MEEEPLPLDSDKPINPPPTLRDVGGTGGGGRSTLLLVFAVIVVLGAGVYALNYFKIIRLWGKKPPLSVATTQLAGEAKEENPPPQTATDQGTSPEGAVANPAPQAESVPVPTVEPAPEATAPAVEKPKPVIPPSGSGNYTVQISSWASKGKADEEVSKLTAAGYTAFVEDATVGGTTWYRVRVGHYATMKEAKEAASQLSKISEEGAWVAKVGG